MLVDLRDVMGATVDGPHVQRRPLLCRGCDGVVILRSVAQPLVSYLDSMDRLPSGEEEDVDPESACWVELDVLQQDFTLCVIGGGQDGLAVASAFARSQLPEGEYGIMVTGPFLPEEKKRQLRSQARENPRLRVLEFLQEPMGLMQRAKRIIAMGGYNTVTEILSLGKPALIVPRNKPRLEQTIRAERLQALGVVDVICLEDLNPCAKEARRTTES